MLVTAGAVGAPGVLILPLQQEFGWQTAEISSALAIRLVLFGLMGPFAAALMNRYGVRRITLAALGLIASCVDAPLGAREIFKSGAARGRVLTCVRPLMRLTRRRPRWESEDQVQFRPTRLKRLSQSWFS